jgi:6-phospho-3-hexuloisomerase
MTKKYIRKMLSEIDYVLSNVDENQLNSVIDLIMSSNNIVTLGAGRMGLVCRSFSMRLAHLGLRAFNINDSVVPSIGENDLLFVCSGSGSTQTIYDLALIAKKHKAKIALVTINPKSKIGKLTKNIIELKAPLIVRNHPGFGTIQPMTSLNEQCLFILCDSLILSLMEKMGETHETMKKRHSILE